MNKATMNTLMSSERSIWETPPEIFNPLNEEFHFNLDVCATAKNTKCTRYFSPKDDGLKQKWYGTCWLNPPYGLEAKKWIKKAHNEWKAGHCNVVALLAARTDTIAFHKFIYHIAEVRFLKGRVKFLLNGKPILDKKSGKPVGAPFPSMIVTWE